MPTIFVTVPVYNVEAYLRRCVDSILRQTFSDFELILVDDGSPDNSGAICDEYAERDNRVRVIHQANGGLSAARNAGIDWAFAHSDSQWLTFIDSDDWVHPEYLELLLAAAQDSSSAVSVCGFLRTAKQVLPTLTDDEKAVRLWEPETLWCEKRTNAAIACGKLYRKELFRNQRYPVGKLHEDEFVTYKLLFRKKQLAVLDAPLYIYFQNDEGIMRSQWTPKRMDALEAQEEQLAFFRGKSFQKAYSATVYQYRNVLKAQISDIDRAGREDAAQYKNIVRQNYRKLLSKNSVLLPYSEYQDSYDFCFSKPVNLLWKFKDRLRKGLSGIKRKLIRRQKGA